MGRKHLRRAAAATRLMVVAAALGVVAFAAAGLAVAPGHDRADMHVAFVAGNNETHTPDHP